MSRLGIDYQTLRKANPRIILVSISGFGQYGPYSRRLSFDPIAQAMSGFMMLNADACGDKDSPVPLPEAPGDTIPGMFGTIGVLAALYHRQLTGEGQHVDVAQLDSLVSVNISMTYHMMTGYTWREASRAIYGKTAIGRTWGLFRAEDGYVYIAAARGALSDRFREFLGVEELDEETIEAWVRGRKVGEIVDALVEAKIPVAPVFSVEEALENPHLAEREMIVELEHPQVGRYGTPNFPVKFSETRAGVRTGAPLLGEHTEEVLSSLLGMTGEEIQRLREERVI